MYNAGVVIGRVTGVVDDRDAIVVLVEDRSKAKYPVTAACRFFGDKPKAQCQGVGDGDLVKVEGAIKSRQSKDGRWFTEFGAWRLTRLVQEIPMVSRSAKSAAPPPSDDPDNVPF